MKSGNYVHGSAAEKLQADIYKNNSVLNAKKKQKSYFKIKIRAVFPVILIFIFGFAAMYRYAALTELNYSINSTKREYNEMKKENSRLRMEIDSSMDLKKVQELAESKLGMHKPDMFQTIYLAVPKSDFTKVAEQYAVKNESNGSLEKVFNKIGELTKILF